MATLPGKKFTPRTVRQARKIIAGKEHNIYPPASMGRWRNWGSMTILESYNQLNGQPGPEQEPVYLLRLYTLQNSSQKHPWEFILAGKEQRRRADQKQIGSLENSTKGEQVLLNTQTQGLPQTEGGSLLEGNLVRKRATKVSSASLWPWLSVLKTRRPLNTALKGVSGTVQSLPVSRVTSHLSCECRCLF